MSADIVPDIWGLFEWSADSLHNSPWSTPTGRKTHRTDMQHLFSLKDAYSCSQPLYQLERFDCVEAHVLLWWYSSASILLILLHLFESWIFFFLLLQWHIIYHTKLCHHGDACSACIVFPAIPHLSTSRHIQFSPLFQVTWPLGTSLHTPVDLHVSSVNPLWQ